jgi:hypothetical protein
MRQNRNGHFYQIDRAQKCLFLWSGQQDSNLRPSGPKPDALPDCAMPRRTPAFDTRFDIARQASLSGR